MLQSSVGTLLTQQLPRLPLDCVSVRFCQCWRSNQVCLVRGLAGRCRLAQPFRFQFHRSGHIFEARNIFVLHIQVSVLFYMTIYGLFCHVITSSGLIVLLRIWGHVNIYPPIHPKNQFTGMICLAMIVGWVYWYTKYIWCCSLYITVILCVSVCLYLSI